MRGAGYANFDGLAVGVLLSAAALPLAAAAAPTICNIRALEVTLGRARYAAI
jgi:hypothetical protein